MISPPVINTLDEFQWIVFGNSSIVWQSSDFETDNKILL